ncbi:unnamed protein product [Rotaria sp. Silwood1]|nr:unnamed protein product [Rotaria sp. Silwood1]
MFSETLCPGSSQLLSIHLSQDEMINSTHHLSTSLKKNIPAPASPHQSQIFIAELNKLIVYCQSIKMKEHNINKVQDLGELLLVL